MQVFIRITSVLLLVLTVTKAWADPHHNHGVFNVERSSAPEISYLNVVKDEMAGWNLFVATKKFYFSPGEVNQSHENGHGHAHLYINGKKVARLYGSWFHISSLPQGKHTITVTLNNNVHQDYAVSGKQVSKTVVIEQD